MSCRVSTRGSFISDTRRICEDDLPSIIGNHQPRPKQVAPYKLVYYEAYRSKYDALAQERKLKRYNQGYTRLKQRITFSIKGQN